MAVEANRTNPWVRTDIERPSPETKGLIEDYEQPEYEAVLAEVEAAGVALNSLLGLIPAAQQRMGAARQAQLDFFHHQNTRGVI